MMNDPVVTITNLPALTEEERDDAAFRGRDLGWAALLRLFEEYAETQKLTYQKVGVRIKRSRSQVQRWLSSPFNLNLSSLGLLAEGMNAELMITLKPRKPGQPGTNFCHPSEQAMGVVSARTSSPRVTPTSVSSSPSRGTPATPTTSKEDKLLLVDA